MTRSGLCLQEWFIRRGKERSGLGTLDNEGKVGGTDVGSMFKVLPVGWWKKCSRIGSLGKSGRL